MKGILTDEQIRDDAGEILGEEIAEIVNRESVDLVILEPRELEEKSEVIIKMMLQDIHAKTMAVTVWVMKEDVKKWENVGFDCIIKRPATYGMIHGV